MTSRQLNVYDPAMCCSTGVCGPEVDTALVRFAADLDWVAKQGASVRRYNLAQEPNAFVREETVREALMREGVGALPLIVMEGQVLSRGRYPTREELEGWAGIGEGGVTSPALPALAAVQAQDAQSTVATGGCCGGGRLASESASGSGSGCC
jgi:hypothetical protein